MYWYAAIVAMSAAMKIYGDHETAKSKAEAAKQQAEMKRLQAQEILRRSEINIGASIRDAEDIIATQAGSLVKGGVKLEGSAMLVLEDSMQKMYEDILYQRQEAEYKAEQLYMGADIDLQLSGDIRKAERYQMYQTVIGTGASIYSAYK